MIPGVQGIYPVIGAAAADPIASSPDPNTKFLTRFSAATPTEEISGVSGSLAGNANCDTGNKQLVLDGTGDWATWPAPVTNGLMAGRYNVDTNWTLELHTTVAAAQVGGLISRGAIGALRWALYCNGTGNVSFYADAFSAGTPLLLTGAGALDGSEHHIAVVRDGGTWRMYFDGAQVDTEAWGDRPSNFGSNDIGLYIGTDEADTTGRDVAGRIARVKMSSICRYPSGTTFTPPARTAT